MTPPKKPPTRDRDVFVPKTPSPDAMRTTTQPEWSEDTDAQAQALRERNDDTPLNLETLDAEAEARMRTRVKETNNTVRRVSDTVQATNTGIDSLRFETRKDVQKLDLKIGLVDAKVDKVDSKVAKIDSKLDDHGRILIDVVDSVGSMKGVVGELKGAFTEMTKIQDQKRQHEIITFGARVDIEKQEAIAEIKDETDAVKQKRSFMYKVGALVLKILGVAGAIVATAIATHFIESCNK